MDQYAFGFWIIIFFAVSKIIYSSSASQYHIKDIPKIRKFSFQEKILEGEMVSVMCIASTKSQPVSYTWMKNGKLMDDSAENIRFSNTDEVSVLILDPVYLTDTGNYTCTAANAAGKDHQTSYLNVKAPPRWETLPSDITTSLGNSVMIQCIASGSPDPHISWKKWSGNKKTGFSKNYTTISDNSGKNIYKFIADSYEQAGLYECEANNGIVPAITANFTVIIRGKTPVFVSCYKKIRKIHFLEKYNSSIL